MSNPDPHRDPPEAETTEADAPAEEAPVETMPDPLAPSPLSGYRFRDKPEPLEWKQTVLGQTAMAPHWAWTSFLRLVSPRETYHVPSRFGVSAILGITTALALLFGLFRYSEAHPLLYLFTGLLMFVICLVQMRWGQYARPASILAGAALLPLFMLTLLVFMERGPPLWAALCGSLFLVPVGGLCGYLAGTCAGGFFLLMDLAEKYWTEHAEESRPAGPPSVSRLDDPEERL